jgi:hypothetical protein
MKKIIILTALLCVTALPLYAEETEQAEQTATQNTATIVIQKQPLQENSKQVANNNKWSIIIQCNGKIKDTDNTNTR